MCKNILALLKLLGVLQGLKHVEPIADDSWKV